MKRLSTLVRGAALALIASAVAGIVVANLAEVPVVASDYLVRSKVDVSTQVEPASNAAVEVSTLPDWEYTLRLREPKCRFF